MGGDPERLLAKVGLSPRLIEAPDALVPMHGLDAFVIGAIRDTGLALAEHAAPQRLSAMGPLGAAIARCTSVNEGLSVFVQLLRGESARARCHILQRTRARWWCGGSRPDQDDPLRSHVERYKIQLALTVVRHWLGPHWLPSELWMTTAPIPEDERFRSIPRVRYHARVLAFPVPDESLAMSASVLPPSFTTLPEIDLGELTVVEATVQMLRGLLPHGAPTLTDTAAMVGINPRTLQRRFKDAGTSYSEVVAETRRRIALARLTETDASITDIAHDLGYSDPAHFARAFRRWVGVGPRRFRVLRRHGEP